MYLGDLLGISFLIKDRNLLRRGFEEKFIYFVDLLMISFLTIDKTY
jgi:hypothetical protein